MLPRPTRDRQRRRLRGRRDDPGAALRPPRRRPLRRPAGAERLRRAAPLPLQPARPAAARPGAARRLRPRRAARDPRGRRGRLPLRPAAAGDRPHRPRRRRPIASAGSTSGADDYLVKPSLRGAAGADRRRAAPRREPPRGPDAGSASCRSTRRAARSWSATARCTLSKKEFTLLRVLACDPTRVFSKEELLRERLGLPQPGRRPGPWTPTPAGCGANSTPSTAATSSTAGAIGYRLIDG